MIFALIQMLLTIGCLLGDYFNCKKIRICFIIWAICNVGWLCVDLINGAYSRMLLDFVQICFNLYGLRQWSIKYKGGKHHEDE
jgi:nicotinamide riboside transporter PnuC